MSVKAKKRAEYDARKAAAQAVEAALPIPAPQLPEWSFGVGQSPAEERAEMERAGLDGRKAEYTAAQEAARAEDAKDPPAKPKRVRKPKTAPTHAPHPLRSEPLPTPIYIGATGRWSDAFLADHARGVLPATPIPIPADLSGWTRPVAEFVALVIGLRLTVGDRRPAPFGSDWTGRHVGCSGVTAWRALKALAEVGFIIADEPLPGRAGHKPTPTYGIPGYTLPGTANTSLNGMPDAEGERGTVPVEAEGIGTRGGTVKPAGEPPDEAGVSDAVGGGPAGTLDGVAAVGDGTRDDEIAGWGHGPERYAQQPTATDLLRRALTMVEAGVRSERDIAFWLARQLQAHEHPGQEEMLNYAGRVSAHFTSSDALSILRWAFRQPPLDPWETPRRFSAPGMRATEVER